MAFIQHELGDAQLAGVLYLWNKNISFPVFYLKQIQSNEDLVLFLNSGDTYNYGRYPNDEIPPSWIVGSQRENLIKCQEYFDLHNGDNTPNDTVYEKIDFNYGKDGQYAASLRFSGGSGNIKFPGAGSSQICYAWYRGVGPNDYAQLSVTQVNTQANLSAGNLEWWLSGSRNGVPMFIKFNDNGIDKYVRLGGSLRYWNIDVGSSNDSGILSVYPYPASDYGRTLYGCPSNTPVTLSEIADGTAIDEKLPVNPYDPGGPSGPGDLPPGTFDDESDPIPDSPLPTLSAANTGFTRIYNPTLSQVQALAQYLWTTPDIIETIWNHIKQFFENPMEAIIGFNLVPVPVPDGGTESFKLMYIDTGVSMTTAANQFVDVDCGTLQVQRYYGSALDQSPYTKVSCFLPFVGTVQLNTDEVMGSTLQIKYRVDICSGACVAKIFIDGSCLYQYSGHCAINIPISAANFSGYVQAVITAIQIGAAAVGGAAPLPPAENPNASQQTNQVVTSSESSTMSFNQAATVTGVSATDEGPDSSSTKASFSGIAAKTISNTVGAVMSAKPHIEHSGTFSGNNGYLGVRRPFIIIERPNMCMPANYQALNGFPSMITMELGSCKGFTRVQQVQLTGMTATNPEQAEILELLKSGVVF